MNTFQEINTLRKSGRLDEAYAMAMQALQESPNDLWLSRALDWVVYEYLDKYASVNTKDEYLKWLGTFTALPHGEDSSILFRSVCWTVRKLLHDAASKEIEGGTLDEVFRLCRSIPFPTDDNSYSALLSAAIKLEKKWQGLYEFVQWWDLFHLSDEDYKEVKLENGRSMMSLAERVYIFLSKWLLANGTDEMLKDFIPRLKLIVELRTHFVYPPYYLAKLYIKLGECDKANELLKTFAKKKSKDFWVWQLLAEAQSDEDLVLSFYCKALSCGGKEEMLVSLREDAATLMAKRGHLQEAKLETDKAVATRRTNGWRIPDSLTLLQNSDWFSTVEAAKDNRKFYMSHASLAEEFVYGQIQKYLVLVTYVNQEKRMVSFVTEDKKHGFFKCPKNIQLPKVNRMLSIQVPEVLEGKPSDVRRFDVIEGMNNETFFNPFTELLRCFPQGFGLAGKVFVEPTMLKQLTDKQKVRGIAVLSYDRKKNKWGWKAMEIQGE